MRRLSAFILVATSGAARAEPVDGGPSTDQDAPIKHRINVRAGLASSDDVGRPAICLEVVTVFAVSVEGCGTGSGILHDEVGRQIAHFRANVPLVRRRAWGGRLSLRGGLGFAELEVGPDRPGFDCKRCVNPTWIASARAPNVPACASSRSVTN